MSRPRKLCAHCADPDHYVMRACPACSMRVCIPCFRASTNTDCAAWMSPAEGSPEARKIERDNARQTK